LLLLRLLLELGFCFMTGGHRATDQMIREPAKLSTSDHGTCGSFGRIGSQMPTQLNWQNNFRFAREPTGIGTRQSRP